jgi:hypothetical protein
VAASAVGAAGAALTPPAAPASGALDTKTITKGLGLK